MWAVLAFARLRAADKAYRLFTLLNPINHCRTLADVQRYQVEPYVVAADVYSVAPHIGRGGWTWYTGSAAWMYRAGLEGILGIRRAGDVLIVDPCIPSDWPGFETTVKVADAVCRIEVRAAREDQNQKFQSILDGVEQTRTDAPVRIPLDGRDHHLLMFI
jgi:cyclic beta-1,2-glucan synthetase